MESGDRCISPRNIGQFSLKDCGIQLLYPDVCIGRGWGLGQRISPRGETPHIDMQGAVVPLAFVAF